MSYPGQQYHNTHHNNQGYQHQQQPYGQPQYPPPQGYGPYPGEGYQQYPGPPPQQLYNAPLQTPYGQGPPQGWAPQQPGHNQYGPPPGGPPRPLPTQPQHYGPILQGSHGQTQQPAFQYSNCSGKRKALLIGINYTGTSSALSGCINDARNVQAFLCSRFHYRTEDIVMLTDDAKDPRQQPTRQNILNAMQWLVSGAQPNDALFFHYSGHGGQTKDLDGDEDDGYDETIYPVDFKQTSHIVDDDMHSIMVRPLPAGCRLTAIFDSCHSGSALDLPYIYSTEGKIKEPNLLAEAGQGLLGAGMSYLRGDMGGLMKGAMSTFKSMTTGGGAQEKARQTKTSPADVISFSGCKDNQTSADTQEAGKATGAMSYAFIAALTKYPQQSYQQLLVCIREELKGRYDQKPQLSSSHPIDVSLEFVA